MPRTLLRSIMAAVAVAAVLLVQPGGAPRPAQALDIQRLTKIQQRLISGFAAETLSPPRAPATPISRSYTPTSDDGCPQRLGPDIKVNQNCQNVSDPDLAGRGQAENETAIAQDPLHPGHIVAGFNDYRRGDGNCYGAFSIDGGRNWTDTTIPMSFTRGTAFGAAREYWQAGGDPSVAWDTKGNAYFSCQMFMRGAAVSPNPDESSSVYVFRSTGNFGASWDFPGRPVVEASVLDDSTGGLPLEDKPYMTVDNHVGSPFQDRIYDTWTEFAPDGTSYIYEASSADYGQTFSNRVLVSSTSALCPNTYGSPTPQGACNENQDSQPFTGPEGALYVVFSNYNNAVSGNDNRNQILLVKSTDGGKTFSAPVKVADFYDLPDCATYQNGADAGRACVPEKGPTANSIFRANNYASATVNPANARQVAVSFGSYINVHSNEANGCIPAGLSTTTGANLYTGVKTPGACNNDILLSVSNDGGASFTGTTTDPRQLTSVTAEVHHEAVDQFWQWAAFTDSGRLAVSYFDRRYGDDETTGASDISLSGSSNLIDFSLARVTTSSMPPPTQFSGLFYGDYSGLAAVDAAHPLWMDTRNPELFVCPSTGAPGTPPTLCTGSGGNWPLANDQDIFTRTLNVPAR